LNRNTELQVGILVLVAIVTTATWLLVLKEFKFKTATYPVHVSFHEVAGIKAGAGVSIHGVNKGKVGEVELQRDRVRLTLEIEEGTFISRDARFILQFDMINPASIRVEQGTSPEAIAAEAEIEGRQMVGLGAVLEGSTSLLGALHLLAARVDSLTASGRLDRLVEEFESGARGLRKWTDEGRGETKRVLKRIDSLASTLEETVAENRAPLGEAIEGVGRFSVRADSLAGELQLLAGSLRVSSARLEAGEGSLGRAIADEELYENLTRSIARVDSLVEEIRSNPKKYFSFSIF